MKRIESRLNPQVKQWKKLQMKKERDNTGKFIIEGPHLVEEALKKKGYIEEILLTESFQVPSKWNLDELQVIIVSQEVMNELGETETPQGVAAICKKPQHKLDEAATGAYLLIDAVQDPGNLGTLIRTADAAGISGVIVGEGTVDVFNSKVIRASQGSIFHIPIVKGCLNEWIPKLQSLGHTVYGTSLENAEPYINVTPTQPFSLIVGNEGRGVQKEWLSVTNQNLYIPIYGSAESLNVTVAAGILLYYLQAK
ncbi:TrmH family RNA methyltransferase [Bacillus sp. DJP31]|uniref:TrmH family RNA methyltransferase n=1 Tax=Bacillus sp. DJP31 TaxID=3409789 RepID=UPI003BB4F5C3